MAFEPPHNIGTMGFDGLERSSERRGDLPAIFTLCQKLYDFALAGRKPKGVVLPFFFCWLSRLSRNTLGAFVGKNGFFWWKASTALAKSLAGVGLQTIPR